jgi:hypothetical protein
MNRNRIAIALALAAGASFACQEKSGGKRLPPEAVEGLISDAEVRNGTEACKRYQEQICSCVGIHKELESECEMAPSRGEAFELSVRSARAEGNASLSDRQALVGNARKIVHRCVEDANAAVLIGCPAISGPAGAASGPAGAAGEPAEAAGAGAPPNRDTTGGSEPAGE